MIENKQKMPENEVSAFERFEAFLFSRRFIFLVVIAGTIPMIMHSHQLFYTVSPFDGNKVWKNVYALFYAVSFDLTVLVFTIHVIRQKPKLYAIFVFVINLLYFDPFSDLVKPAITTQDIILAFTKAFLSGVLAYTGYSYAELFVGKAAESKKKQKRVHKIVNRRVDKPGKQENGEFPCLKCGKLFSSKKALNGHMVAHRND